MGDVVFPRLKSDIDVIRRKFPKATVIWLGASARHRDDFAMQTNERVIRFNADMNARIQNAGFEQVVTLDLFHVTLAMHSYDGTHYGPAVNKLRSSLLLQLLSDQKPARSNVAKT